MQRNLTNVTKLRTYPHPLADKVVKISDPEAHKQDHISLTDSKASKNQETY